ncbi:hypothetical protein GEV33_001886 [Tenebrio molitor]|uniref:Uncharacterized protein n=1 Tax=Tenebrio molitor TaxID=7067 RepID=A0A8J6HUC5_TENMO|nr:hypothetical protein GEV33_001886 [Tenebrio molitor]
MALQWDKLSPQEFQQLQDLAASSIMMRGSNHGRRLQSATFRGCVGCSVSTCNGPVCSLGCTARPQSPQRKTATARYLGTGMTGMTVYDRCIWLLPPAVPTRRARSTA